MKMHKRKGQKETIWKWDIWEWKKGENDVATDPKSALSCDLVMSKKSK